MGFRSQIGAGVTSVQGFPVLETSRMRLKFAQGALM